MKKYLLTLFIFITLFSSCTQKNEFKDIDWLFNTRFFTIDELKSQINLNFVTNWNVGNNEGWTYNYSNNEFDYEYRFNFTNNKLKNIETIIKPINISPQKYNLKLRKYITKKFKLSSFTGILPEQGLEFKIENLLINGLRFEIYFRNRQFPPSLFGKWEFRYDNKTISDINDGIVLKPGYSMDRDKFLEESKNIKIVWEINDQYINIIDNKYEYDLVDNEIIFYYSGDIIETEVGRRKYTIEKNNTMKVFLKVSEYIGTDDGDALIDGDDLFSTSIYLVGNKIE